MGHVMLMGLGSSGDVNPLLGIGTALRDRGHDVTFVSAPQFESAASSIGADFHPIGTAAEYDAVYADPDLWHPRRGLGVFFPYAAGRRSRRLVIKTMGLVVRGQKINRCWTQCGAVPSTDGPGESTPESSPTGISAPAAFGSRTLMPIVCDTSLGYSTSRT